MLSHSLIELALGILNCNQKELAKRLNVSPTQITKWKKGEYISTEMQLKLESLLPLEGLHPDFVLAVGAIAQAKQWHEIIHFLAESAQDNCETGYDTLPLLDENGLLDWEVSHILTEIGLPLPKIVPNDLASINFKTIWEDEDKDFENLWEILDNNLHTKIIYQIFNVLNDIYGFYIAYIEEVVTHEKLNNDNQMLEVYFNISDCLMSLATVKLENVVQTPEFLEFRYQTLKEYRDWLLLAKQKAVENAIPLRAEFLDLLSQDHNALGHEAEAETLGFNDDRIHPDIYMNELLIGIRTIHQVLPAILKKLEIYDEFYLDDSKFREGR